MSWKESKFFIAVSSCVATTIFLVTIFSAIIIPTWLESYKAEIKELKKKSSNKESKKTDSNIDKMEIKLMEQENQIKQLKNRVISLNVALIDYYKENIFKDNDPYPLGFRALKIGSSLDNIENIYLASNIDWHKSFPSVSVSIKHKYFSRITYDYEVVDGKEFVSSISFYLRNPSEILASTFKKLLIDSFHGAKFEELENKIIVRGKKPVIDKYIYFFNINGISLRIYNHRLAYDESFFDESLEDSLEFLEQKRKHKDK